MTDDAAVVPTRRNPRPEATQLRGSMPAGSQACARCGRLTAKKILRSSRIGLTCGRCWRAMPTHLRHNTDQETSA